MTKPLVFIAGPYTNGDVAVNVARAIHWADWIMNIGCAVFVPHLSHFQHMMCPREYEDWTENDLVVLRRCDALYRLDGESMCADNEAFVAHSNGIPVFTSPAAIREWAKIQIGDIDE